MSTITYTGREMEMARTHLGMECRRETKGILRQTDNAFQLAAAAQHYLTQNVGLTSTYSRKLKSIGINLPFINEYPRGGGRRIHHLAFVSFVSLLQNINVNLFTNHHHLKALKSSQ